MSPTAKILFRTASGFMKSHHCFMSHRFDTEGMYPDEFLEFHPARRSFMAAT